MTVWLLEKIISLRLNEGVTIKAAKCAISKKSGIKPYQQRLMYAGKKLKDDHTLSRYTEPAKSVKSVKSLRLLLIKSVFRCVLTSIS